MDQKYVAYNALLCETDTSLIKNQRTTFVVFHHGAQVELETEKIQMFFQDPSVLNDFICKN